MAALVPYEMRIAAGFPTEESLQAAVDAFVAAVCAHAFTVGVPAPTAHPLVEDIVRNWHANYVCEPPPPEPEAPPALPAPEGE